MFEVEDNRAGRGGGGGEGPCSRSGFVLCVAYTKANCLVACVVEVVLVTMTIQMMIAAKKKHTRLRLQQSFHDYCDICTAVCRLCLFDHAPS